MYFPSLYAMGRFDIQFIPTPKGELLRWWKQLDQLGQECVKSRIGHLLPLLQINIHSGVMQALPHFWCPETSTFIFGKFELTPTLEEYSLAIGMPLGSELVKPIGIDPVVSLSRFLKNHSVREIVQANNNAFPLSSLTECFEKQSMTQKAKIFLLAFFGFIIFPHRKNAIDPSITWVINQVIFGAGYVNMVLAETFLSLNRFKDQKEKIMRAAPEILQMWFFSHIKGFGHLMQIFEINEFKHPLQKFQILEKYSPNEEYSRWINLLKNPVPETFLWRAKWFIAGEARFALDYYNPIPLLGLSGATSYYPYRVARQYRVLQEVPPPLKSGLFRIFFTRTDYNYLEEIRIIQNAWSRCHTEKIVVPRRLKEQEKVHHASTFYILNHIIPKELQPVIPDVVDKLTLQGRIESLEKSLETSKRHVSKLVRRSKRLHKTGASHRI